MFRNGLREAGGTDMRVGAVSDGQFLKRSGNTLVGGSAVTGPVSSTDNAIARFDGTGGATLQNSGVTIDDSNNIAGVGTLATGSQTVTGDIAVSGTVDGIDLSVLAAFMPQHRVLTSDHSTTSVTAAAVTGLTFAGLVAGTYIFQCGLAVETAAATTGIKLGMNFTGTSSTEWHGHIITENVGSATTASFVAALGKGGTINTANLTRSGFRVYVPMSGSFIATGSGDLQILFATEVAASTATVGYGSWATVHRVS